jgi:hypothetical protein
MVELYLYSYYRLHGMALNILMTGDASSSRKYKTSGQKAKAVFSLRVSNTP